MNPDRADLAEQPDRAAGVETGLRVARHRAAETEKLGEPLTLAVPVPAWNWSVEATDAMCITESVTGALKVSVYE